MASDLKILWPTARLEEHPTLVGITIPTTIFNRLSPKTLPAGYTTTQGRGFWTSESGQEFTEPVITITMSGHNQPMVEAMARVVNHAFMQGEQAVYVVIDGKAFIYHKE